MTLANRKSLLRNRQSNVKQDAGLRSCKPGTPGRFGQRKDKGGMPIANLLHLDDVDKKKKKQGE
jgi:hypothetical protein